MAVPFKEAAINWILTHGEVATSMYGASTAEALHVLATLGIDFEESETPVFGQATIDHGDTDNGATKAEAVSATVVAKGSKRFGGGYGKPNHEFDFVVSMGDFNQMLLGVVIMGVVNNADGAQEWTARCPERIAQIKEREARDAERQARWEAARAAQAAAAQD